MKNNLRIKEKNQKIGCEFDKELEEIRRIRFSTIDKDLRQPISRSRLTDGIIHYPEWKAIKEKLMRENRKENKWS